ncbi:MAG: TonB-dependent receptor, partial [Chitinophagaceae bacterium]|nr:TonB-dependent receptor [Chitinophagaceae bacterium]
ASYLSPSTTFENQFYYSYYNFNLHSNFTFFLNDPINGDQIRQREGRNIFGYHSKLHTKSAFRNLTLESVYGAGFRLDQTKNSELSHTINRNTVLSYTQFGDIKELNGFVYADETFLIGKWAINTGLRLDNFVFNYNDKLLAAQLPRQNEAILSPKISLQYTIDNHTQVYVKTGKGFHSNDARVVVFNRGQQILPAAYGADLGVMLKPAPRLFINAALWYLYLQQEFVYVGDEGVVEPSGKTRRIGVDLGARYQLTNWLFADANFNLSKPRSIEESKGNDFIPLAPTFTSTGGVSWKATNGINGSLRYRHMSDRAANEDKSVIAQGYTVTDLSLNYTNRRYEIGIAIENLFDVKWNETQFNTESRLKNEPTPTNEIHFTPGVPFFARLKLAVFF